MLCNKLQCLKKLDTNKRRAISLEKRIAISLYSLDSSCEYRTVANLFGVSRTTVGKIMLDFCTAVYNTMKEEYINSYPPLLSKVKKIVAGFEKLGFPQCFGAVDGCHIEISPHKDEAVDFYNFKGWYSIILFASADYRCRFTYINVGAPGRNNDSYIFENSSLKKCHETNSTFHHYYKIINGIRVPVLLIGDSAFILSKYLMKPYPYKVNQPKDEKIFNYRLSKCRRVVENTFGHLKARFRKVGKGLEVRPENAPIIIKSCCILHNLLNEEKDDIWNSWLQEYEKDEESRTNRQPQYTTTRGENNFDGQSIRRAIKAFFDRDHCPLVGVDVCGESAIRNEVDGSGESVIRNEAEVPGESVIRNEAEVPGESDVSGEDSEISDI